MKVWVQMGVDNKPLRHPTGELKVLGPIDPNAGDPNRYMNCPAKAEHDSDDSDWDNEKELDRQHFIRHMLRSGSTAEQIM